MTDIDLYSMTTVPIEAFANGQPLAKATGFIWQDGPQHYLITNWHVVTGRDARTNLLTVPYSQICSASSSIRRYRISERNSATSISATLRTARAGTPIR
jgi:hypothetical protein